ncbi:MAG TPA: histidine kinase dimerization/phospho-acceptor domain-containing protein [Fibrobacteria bacterium]|nr:histidine kinase dimerization/phospho-acceptor domain-containing protein [Fibrobacteria bacterium]HOX50517.1 histidine kinase dimerization/phospho-acceptor domain-containing protein [Fibrobacteria bacterium]
MSGSRKSRLSQVGGSKGLVDHDSELRHRLIGWLQISTLGVLVLVVLLPIVMKVEGGPRTLVMPGVLGVGLLIQRMFWMRYRDVAASHVWLGTLTLGCWALALVNGSGSPGIGQPILITIMAGYLLGNRAAWGYAIVSLLAIWVGTGYEAFFLSGRLVAPYQIWVKVFVVFMSVSALCLVFPLRGYFSAIALMESERASLDQAMERLRRRQETLQTEIHERTAELSRANMDLESFSHSLSHDLQTPMRAIHGYARILSEGNLDAGRRKEVDRLLEQSARLGALLDETLRQSRGARE